MKTLNTEEIRQIETFAKQCAEDIATRSVGEGKILIEVYDIYISQLAMSTKNGRQLRGRLENNLKNILDEFNRKLQEEDEIKRVEAPAFLDDWREKYGEILLKQNIVITPTTTILVDSHMDAQEKLIKATRDMLNMSDEGHMILENFRVLFSNLIPLLYQKVKTLKKTRLEIYEETQGYIFPILDKFSESLTKRKMSLKPDYPVSFFQNISIESDQEFLESMKKIYFYFKQLRNRKMGFDLRNMLYFENVFIGIDYINREKDEEDFNLN